MNVLATHMTVMLMPPVRTTKDPTAAPASQRIMEMANAAHMPVSVIYFWGTSQYFLDWGVRFASQR